jgi:group I intron endonuclease
MSYGLIYKAYNKVNQKSYIGQTTKTLEHRKRAHYSKYSSCVLFRRALEKYPKEDWEWSEIDYANSQEELDEKEQYWIAYYDTHNVEKGYNLTDGGQGSPGVVITDEHKRRTRESMLKVVSNNYSKPNSPLKPVKCIELNKNFISYSEASRQTGANVNSIRRVIKGELKTAGGYHWELLTGEERLSCLPNAIYCVELDKIFDNVRQARTEERFHEGNLGLALKNGKPDEPKKYSGYTFYWVNPQYH